MAISKVVYKSSPSATGVTWMDVTGKTVTSASMLNGVTALKNDGTDITGSIANMTLPSSASSTSSGTSKATITPTSSAQYLNIPTGYNDTAQYYTIGASSGGGVDMPVFTLTNNGITCDKTFAECNAYVSNGVSSVYMQYKDGGAFIEDYPAAFYSATPTTLTYVLLQDGCPTGGFTYNSNGTISFENSCPVYESLSATANGTYTPSVNKLFNEAVVNVSGGTSKNVQVLQSTSRTNSSSLTKVLGDLTVSKTGIYDVYWSGGRTNTSTSYTWGTRLYVDGTGYGTENTTWSNNCQSNHLSNVSLTANQKLSVYARGRTGSYYTFAPMLVIVES